MVFDSEIVESVRPEVSMAFNSLGIRFGPKTRAKLLTITMVYNIKNTIVNRFFPYKMVLQLVNLAKITSIMIVHDTYNIV